MGWKKYNASNNEASQFLSSFIVPLSFVIIGIIISILISSTIIEGIIVSLLLGIISNQLQQNIINASYSNKIENNQDILKDKINEIIILSKMQEKIVKIDHPYFNKLLKEKLDLFLIKNKELFEGNHYAKLIDIDMFYSSPFGLKSTRSILQAISNPWNYTDKGFSKKYLEYQKKLIIENSIKIQRIFLLNNSEFNSFLSEMENQKNIGIEVYYIIKNSEDIYRDLLDVGWLDDDYLIQDGVLLVDVYQNRSHTINEQIDVLITINPTRVKEKIERFEFLLDRATMYFSK